MNFSENWFEEYGINTIRKARSVDYLEKVFNYSCIECMRRRRNFNKECDNCPIYKAYEEQMKKLRRPNDTKKWVVAWRNPRD